MELFKRMYKFNRFSIGMLLLIAFLQPSCKKLEFERIMDTSTDTAVITGTTVTVYGTVLDLGTNKIIHHGHCWSQEHNPDINDDTSDLGTIEGTGKFFSKLNNITPGLPFYVRSYLFDGTTYLYGDEITFTISAADIQFYISEIKKIDATTIDVSSSTAGLGSVNFSNHGHCWSQTDPPTVENDKTSFGNYLKDEVFISRLNSMNQGRYYIRGYLESDGQVLYTNSMIYESKINVETGIISFGPDQLIEVYGNITSLGVNPITDHGHCWSTETSQPNLNSPSQYTSLGPKNQLTNFSSQLPGLVSGRKYYIRAYATDGNYVYYGEIESFTAQ
ncbi:MAG: hypothetical protein U0W24_24435 [Bacteroidales bacterium]